MLETLDLGALRPQLHRTPWNEFPDVAVHTGVAGVKSHPLYSAAKEGDARAAEGVVVDSIADVALERVKTLIGNRRPCLLAVHAVELEGMNAIPRVLARAIAIALSLPIGSGVIQVNRVAHTGASGYHRLAFPAIFAGEVEPIEYVLVDDFVGQGGTLANLKGFVEHLGGRVIGATALTAKSYSAILRLTDDTLAQLRAKHGTELEEWWTATFGYGFERLTESEARYLTRGDNAHIITERIASARRAGD